MKNLSLIILSVFLLISCSRTSSYYVRVGNIGNTGVIILDGPIKYKLPLKITQGLNGRDTGSPLSKAIKLHYIHPPDEITLTWQLADLNNCEIDRPRLHRPGYSTKYECDWHPLPNKVFTKTINLREAKKSKAFKEKGSWGGMFQSRRKAAIILDFDDENVIVSTTSWSDNKLANLRHHKISNLYTSVE